MGWTIRDLMDDVIERVKSLPDGDYINLGWFSSPGDFDFPIKGYKLGKDRSDLIKILNGLKSVLGSTCFSDALQASEKILDSQKALGVPNSLLFWTDGCTNAYPLDQEYKKIEKSLKTLAPQLGSALLVGYGDYYNKELMSKMAAWVGGSLTHAQDIGSYKKTYTQYQEDVRGSKPRYPVTLPITSNEIFSITGRSITVYEQTGKEILYTPSKGDQVVFFTSQNPVGKVLEPNHPSFEGAMYALAYVLSQRLQADKAIEVLAELGDVKLIDSLSNAFTPADFGKAEAAILEAVVYPGKRYTGGKAYNYVPADDAYSVLDLMEDLMADEEALFYPNHAEFEYKRTGRATEDKPGALKFKADTEAGSPISDLTWNQTRLNLSLRATIPGTVELPKAFKGLKNPYPCVTFRNYVIIKDRYLHTTKLPVSLSEETFNKLQSKGIIHFNARWNPGHKFILSLDDLPVINKATAEGRKTTAAQTAKTVIQELKLMGTLKALKAKYNELTGSTVAQDQGSKLTEDQKAFLAQYHIKNGTFNPPQDPQPPTDFYEAPEFDIKVKGLSSLPSVKDVEEKLAKKGNLTLSQSFVNEGLLLFEKINKGKDVAEKLKKEILKLNKELAHVRSETQKDKFALVLSKRWYPDLKTRENAKVSVGELEVTFSLKEVRIDI
jgi:hypothetical protein